MAWASREAIAHSRPVILAPEGVLFSPSKPRDAKGFKEKLLNVGVWSNEDLKGINEAREEINSIKPQEW